MNRETLPWIQRKASVACGVGCWVVVMAVVGCSRDEQKAPTLSASPSATGLGTTSHPSASSAVPTVPKNSPPVPKEPAAVYEQPWRRGIIEQDVWLSSQNKLIPQLQELATRYKQLAKKKPESVSSATLICKLVVSAQLDGMSDPDVDAEITIDKYSYHLHGDDNEKINYFSLPNIPYNAHSQIELTVKDRDLLGTSKAGQIKQQMNGMVPFQVATEALNLSCVPMDPADVEKEVHTHHQQAKSLLPKIQQRIHPDPAEEDWDYWGTSVRLVWNHVDTMAALVGWNEPRVSKLVAELHSFDEQWNKAAKTVVEKVRKELPGKEKSKPIALRRLQAQFESTTCNPTWLKQLPEVTEVLGQLAKTRACYFRIKIERTAEQESWKVNPRIALQKPLAVLQNGREVELKIVAALDDKNQPLMGNVVMKPHQKVSLIMIPATDVAMGTHPGRAPENLGGPVRLLRLIPKDSKSFVRID
jgi:hypothetical protein